ncbi:hypothetical protein MesoLjLb_66690 [Mesorhizobium sp. L-8-3]|nr:hypothetical protein MesoLjLb_66690 [Mesorhizobium sp. L-8-3]
MASAVEGIREGPGTLKARGEGRVRQDKGTASDRRLSLCLHIAFPGGCQRHQEAGARKPPILLQYFGRLA